MATRCIATIEARMTSSRLPGKVLLPLGDKPALQVLIERLQQVQGLDEIVVATTVNATDDPIVELAKQLNVSFFRGSESDVLSRVCGALKTYQADVCVEITADCPLIDPWLVEEALTEFLKTQSSHPYLSNSDPERSVPAGLDVQVFLASALYTLNQGTTDHLDREHVSYGFYRPDSKNSWKTRFIKHASCIGGEDLWVTLDYIEDYTLIKALHESLAPVKPHYRAADIIQWIQDHLELHNPCLQVRGL